MNDSYEVIFFTKAFAKYRLANKIFKEENRIIIKKLSK